MACIAKLQIEQFNTETLTKEKEEISLGTIDNDQELTVDKMIDFIINLPQSKRNTLAAQLRAASVQKFSESDFKKHIFVSNISVNSLMETYPDLKEAFPDLDISVNDNFTLIQNTRMEINGSNYFGRTLDSEGNEIFFINGYYGAEHFFKYLTQKNKIDKVLENNKLVPEFKEYQKPLEIIAKKYNKSVRQVLIDYLNNKNKYTPFAEEGKNIVPSKILNDFFLELMGEYNENRKKTELQYAIESIQTKTKNPFQYRLQIDKLYDVLDMYFSKYMPKKETFLSMTQSELQSFLNSIFISDPKLARSRILSIDGGEISSTTVDEKEHKISKAKIEEAWKKLQEKYKQQNITLQSINKALKNSKEQFVGQLKEALADYSPDYQNVDISIQDDKISAKYIQDKKVVEKATKKYITLHFPWSSIGEIYNFGYDTKYLFSPVQKTNDNKLDSDGMYKGVYVYKYYNDKFKTTHYAISRSIISPDSYMETFPSLESALYEIDNWQNTHKINEWGLWTIKESSGRPRNVKLEYRNIQDGQIITVLDMKLPSVQIKYMPQLFKNAFAGSVSNFHKLFKEIENIEDLNTPEKASAFLIKFYDQLKTLEKNNTIDLSKNISTIISNNKDLAKDIINEINQANTVSYRIEGHMTANNILLHTIKYLQNNGTNIEVSGKFQNDISANKPLISSLESAAKYFNDLFGIKTTILSYNELSDFIEKNNINENVKNVKAFVYNGDIYINSSNSDMSDFFHEISHIFLGVLKVKYPKDYVQLIEEYSKAKGFNSQLAYMNKLYKDFSFQDRVEEAVVAMIAKKMFNKKSLVESFEGKDFLQDFELIMSRYPEFAKEKQNTGLEFSLLVKSLLEEETVRTQMNKNMLLSQMVRQLKNDGKILENCYENV